MQSQQSGRQIQKTKSGCLTCKKRRIKCDQLRPTCQKCISVKRECIYDPFAVQQKNPATAQLPIKQASSPNRLLSLFTATQKEWQSYSFYTHKASRCIGGELDFDFWHDTILQISQTEPSVRYALFSIGDLFRHSMGCSGVYEDYCRCQHYRTAMQHYNKSIAILKPQIDPSTPNQIVLLTCILYTCIESLCGNDRSVLSLIRQASNIFAIQSQSSESTVAKSPDIKYIGPLLNRLSLLSILFAQPLAIHLNHEMWKGSTSTLPNTIAEARDMLYLIMNEVLSLQLAKLRAASSKTSRSTNSTVEIVQWEQKVADSLELWRHGFEKLSETHHNLNYTPENINLPNKPQSPSIYVLLDAYYDLTKIWVATTVSDEIAGFHTHLPVFQRIVENAERYLEQQSLGCREQGYFTLEFGILPALFFVALRCRDATVRKQTLALLPLTASREGIWDKAEVITVAKRVIELEEDKTNNIRIYGVSTSRRHIRAGKAAVDVTYRHTNLESEQGLSQCCMARKETLALLDASNNPNNSPSVVWNTSYTNIPPEKTPFYRS